MELSARRRFLAGLGAALAWPFAGRAQRYEAAMPEVFQEDNWDHIVAFPKDDGGVVIVVDYTSPGGSALDHIVESGSTTSWSITGDFVDYRPAPIPGASRFVSPEMAAAVAANIANTAAFVTAYAGSTIVSTYRDPLYYRSLPWSPGTAATAAVYYGDLHPPSSNFLDFVEVYRDYIAGDDPADHVDVYGVPFAVGDLGLFAYVWVGGLPTFNLGTYYDDVDRTNTLDDPYRGERGVWFFPDFGTEPPIILPYLLAITPADTPWNVVRLRSVIPVDPVPPESVGSVTLSLGDPFAGFEYTTFDGITAWQLPSAPRAAIIRLYYPNQLSTPVGGGDLIIDGSPIATASRTSDWSVPMNVTITVTRLSRHTWGMQVSP